MKKLLVMIVGLSFICLCLAITVHFVKPNQQEDKKELFRVADVSMNCFSNVLIVYDDNTYELLKGSYVNNENPVIGKGTYNYDIEGLLEEIKTYPIDDETGINYRVTLNDKTSYTVSVAESPKLNDFLKTIPEKNLFWCS